MTTLEDLWVKAYDPKARRHLEYPGGSYVDGFDRFTTQFADKVALDFFGAQTTYTELRRAVAYVAGWLHEKGVRPGDHVALLMPTCPQHVVAFYAVLACGATIVEHNPLYTEKELTPLFEDHKADVAIIWDAAAPKLQNLPEHVRPSTIVSINLIEEMPLAKRLLLKLPIKKARESRASLSKPAPGTIPFSELLAPREGPPAGVRPQPEDIALLLYTSGTTGVPKGVPLTHTNLLASTQHALEWVTMMVPGEEVFMACLPLFHIFGCSLSMNAGLSVGALVHLVPKPEAGLILDAIKRKTPTVMLAVPPLFERVVDAATASGQSIKGIRTGICGAMPLRAELIEKWEKATGGLLIEGYGLSECSPILTGNPVNPTRKPKSIGIPFPDTHVRLVDPDNPGEDVPFGTPGEIVAKGPQIFGGYRNPEDNESAFHDGWFRTGDIAQADEDGFLSIVDRIKEVVITGGFNVYPTEVEDALRGENGIQDVAVVGLVNELGTEEVVAAVVTREGLVPNLDEVRQAAKEKLASYKVPRRIYLVEDLPRNEMGKVLRREVRTKLQEQDLSERISSLGPEIREWFASKGEDIRTWFDEAGTDLRERYEASGLREPLEALDADFRQRIGEASTHLRERLESFDLPRRLEVLRASVFGPDDDAPPASEKVPPFDGEEVSDDAAAESAPEDIRAAGGDEDTGEDTTR
ncbi:MAG TPA: AMP-binding protein [Actinomycetales bacterium]|nr:AMP-binding protein [Actinomycetales bacterium]